MSENEESTPASPEDPAGTEKPPAAPVLAEGSPGQSTLKETVNRLGSEFLRGPVRIIIPLGFVAIIIWFMQSAASILAPTFLAMFMVMAMSPALHWMRRKGMSPGLALTIVMVAFLVLGALFVVVMLGALADLEEQLPVYQANMEQMASDLEAWFMDRGIDISGLFDGTLNPENVTNFISSLIQGAVNAMSSIVLLIIVILFMVAEVYGFPNKLREKMHVSEKFNRAFHEFSDLTRTYLFTKAWLSAIMAVIVTFIYLAFGTDFAVVWGILFFVLSFIPNIGFVLAVIPPFFVTLLESGFAEAATVLIIVIVVNAIVDNGLSPKIMGKSVGISSLVVFLSVMFWVWVFGGLGGLMCVPLTLMVKILLFDTFESTRPISAFMEATVRDKSEKKPKEPFMDKWRRRIHVKKKSV